MLNNYISKFSQTRKFNHLKTTHVYFFKVKKPIIKTITKKQQQKTVRKKKNLLPKNCIFYQYDTYLKAKILYMEH